MTSAADIWTYGLVLWEMIALTPPHLEVSEDESFNETINETDTMDDTSDDTNYDMDKSASFLQGMMPRVNKKYGKQF